MSDTTASRLHDEVRRLPWYHTLELPGGVLTPGEYDLRSALDHSFLPASLAGMRCLDIGTHDGFWAFEMEKRGAAEVVAIDLDDFAELDWPQPPPALTPQMQEFLDRRRQAFQVAHRALGSRVDRRNLSVYDLDADEVGTFDFAVIGTLLHHLRDPVGALIAARRVVTGELFVSASFSVFESVLHPRRPRAEMVRNNDPFWELPNLTGLQWQLQRAGWTVVRRGRPYLQTYGAGWRHAPIDVRKTGLGAVPRQLLLRRGAPHVSLLARPSS